MDQNNSEKDISIGIMHRAENGGLDPSWLDFAFNFQSRGPKILI